MGDQWWMHARVYELYVERFANDLKGLTDALGYFNEIGIDTLHLLPIFTSPMVDGGYDVSEYRSIRPELGTLEDFKGLVDAARARGIRLIIDLVLNHTSAEHPWFIEARSSKGSPKREYYLWSDDTERFSAAHNAFPDFKPSNWIANEATSDYYFATFYPQQPDLNWDNPAVLEEFIDIIDFWAGFGVSGFRLDAAPHLIKRDACNSIGLSETHSIIKKMRSHLDARHPGVVLLAEVNLTVDGILPYFGDGDECHLCYHFPLMKEMWLALMTGDSERMDRMTASSFTALPHGTQWAVFLRNHDEINLSELSVVERNLLLAWMDPSGTYTMEKMHATAERMGTIFGGDEERYRRALELLYSTPGAPVMYYGDEIGMKNLEPDETVIDTRRFVRGQFDWDMANDQLHNPGSLLAQAALLARRSPVQTSPEGQSAIRVEV